MENAWYYLALKSAIPMATMSGFAQDTVQYRTRMNSISTNFAKVYWNTAGLYFVLLRLPFLMTGPMQWL